MKVATNLAINEDLLNEALKLGGLKTKKDTVNQALEEYILRRKQKNIISLFGSIPYDADYDAKSFRKRS